MAPDPPPRCCGSEELARIGFEGRRAAEDREEWCSEGPRRETQELIDVLLAEGVEGASLMDIGAGVGAVHVTLLEAGAANAVDVDASPDYLDEAKAEAERRGLVDRIDYRLGDVVELAADLPPADIVTADSVICCYPYLPELLAAAVAVRAAAGWPDLHQRHLVAAGHDAGVERDVGAATAPGPLEHPPPR